MHRLTAYGQWAVQLQCTASLPWGSRQWNSCDKLPHCSGRWAMELLRYTASLPRGSGQWNSYNSLPHCLGAVGSETPAIHCFITRGVGSAARAMHCLTAWGRWAVQLVQYTASLPGGSEQ